MNSESPSQNGLVQPGVLSLGMVVLDELRFPDRDTLYDVPGGSGTYGEYMTSLSVQGLLAHSSKLR